MSAAACRRRPSKRRRDGPDHALPSSKQPVMTRPAADASCSSGGAASAPSYALPRRAHFFVRATDSKTIAMHAGWDDTVGAVLGHLAACGYGRDLRLLYAGRQLAPEATLAALRLPPDSTLHLASRLRSTPHPQAWQLASHIAATAAAAESEAASAATVAFSLDELVKEYISCAHRPRHDRGAPDDAQATGDHTAEYIDIFLQAGAPFALVRLYLSKSSFFRSYAERAIRCFLTTGPSPLPPDVLPVTAPVLLELCRLLSLAVGKKDLLYKSCRSTLASVLSLRSSLPTSMKSPTRVIEQVLPFAREIVEVILDGLASVTMLVSAVDLEEFSNFFKVLRQQACRWMPSGPIPKNLYSRECEHGDSWVWKFHEMSMNLLKRVDECLKRLEMDLPLSSESRGVMESQSRWTDRSHILAMLTELNFISAIYEDVVHSLRSVLLAHKAPLNALVRCSKRNEHLQWLKKHKDLLCFEARRSLVLMMFPEGRDDYGELYEMLIDRSHLLDESFEYIIQAKPSDLHSGLFVEFKTEEATGPGVLREWFCMVCQALFSPQQVLFSPCPYDKRRFYLNGTSAVDPLHMKYFIFSGRVIGLALMHRVQVGIVLDRTLFLHLAGRSITLEDIAVADPVTYASCKRVLEMGAAEIDELTLTFSREVHESGSRRTIEFYPGGQDILVNIRNREHYIDLLIKNIFMDSISIQLAHFAQGFSDILVNPELQKVFFECLDLEDFDRMLGGSSNTINLKDWKLHTQYNGYKEKDRHIIWFWKAGISTRLNQWWSSIPFITSGVILICGTIYLACLLIGYDSFSEICFLPWAVASHFQVYRFYTSVLFHGSLLHVLFNMLALVPLGTELERIMGSVRLLFLMFLLATTNAILHLIIAFLVAYNPLYPVSFLVDECSIGFSGVIFSMIVIETSLSGVQSRSVFGLFNVPAKWYAWILLILFQFLASNVSLLGHLCGILSGFAYTYGLFNYLLPGPSFYSSIEGLPVLSVCVRRPGFILCTGGTTYGQLPTYSNTSSTPSALINGNFLRNISLWMPSRQTSTTQEQEDPRFPGRGRTLGNTGTEPTAREASANLHARLLDNTTPSDPLTNSQHTAANTVRADATVITDQADTFDEELKKLVGMGFEKTQAEVALAAADGDPNVAIEILMSQQG